MVGHSQFVVEIRDILADLRANDLLLHGDSFQNELQSSGILLLLTKLNCDALHRPSLFLISLIFLV